MASVSRRGVADYVGAVMAPDDDTRITEGLRSIWSQAQPDYLDALAKVLDLLEQRPLGESIGVAVDHIHRVAGTIGVFGLVDESRALRALEEQIDSPDLPTDDQLAAAVATVRQVRIAVETHQV